MTMPEYDYGEWTRPEVRAEIEQERQDEIAEQQAQTRQEIVDRINQPGVNPNLKPEVLAGLPYETTGEIKNVIKTSNPDKFVVQMQLKDAPKEYRPVYMNRNEVLKMGGEIPLEQNWKPGGEQRTEQSEARERERKAKEPKPEPEPELVQVGLQTGKIEYITKKEADAIKKDSATLWEQLKRDGISAYNQSVKTEYKLQAAEVEESERKFKESLKEYPKEIQDAYKKDGYDGYVKAVKEYNAKAEKEHADRIELLKESELLNLAHASDSGKALTGKEAFDSMVKSGDIPAGSTFKGVDKDGNIEYIPPFKGTPTLTQYDARYFEEKGWEFDRNKLVKDFARANGKEAIEKAKAALADYDKRLIEANKAYKDKYGSMAKETALTGAENLIPFVATARYWGEMSTKQKVVALSIDTASTLLILYGPKLLKIAGRTITGESQLVKLASKSGAAGKALQTATRDYESVLTSKLPKTQAGLVDMANKVEKARIASVKADKAFLNKLETVGSVTKKELKKIETKSGIKGFKQAVTDVSKAQKELTKAVKQVEKNPVSMAKDNTAALKALDNLAQKQAKLQTALDNAGSVLKPRYTESPPAPEFKGFKTTWEKSNPKLVKREQDILDDMQKWVDETRAGAGGTKGKASKPAVIEATKPVKIKATAKLKLTPEYAEAKPGVKPKVKVPAVTKTKPAVFPRGKTAVTTKTESVPSEAYGRMTREQIIRQYGVDTADTIQYQARSIQDSLVGSKLLSKLNPAQREGIESAIKSSVTAGILSKTTEATDLQAKEAIKSALKPATKLLTATQVKTLTSTVTKQVEKIKLPTKPIGGAFKTPIKLPGGRGTDEKEKEWTPEDVKSAIAWRDGFVVHAIKSPYRRGIDEKSYNVNNLPAGMVVMTNYKGQGSQSRTAKVTGKFPNKLTVDVGNQDVVITKNRKGVNIRHYRDNRHSSSMTTISKKRGRIYRTRAGGSEIFSRRPMRGY